MSDMIRPFDPEYFLGYVNQVYPQFLRIHFPSSVLLGGFTHYGEEFNGGLVGNFVTIEGEKYGFLGRIVELTLPDSERLSLNERAFQTKEFHPVGKVEILLSFDLYNPFSIKKGLTTYPNIGAKVFVCSSVLLQKYMSRFGARDTEKVSLSILGRLVANTATQVHVNLQSIFGRHCAIVGTTGGGKSYTVSKLIDELLLRKNKTILIDATGEYRSQVNREGSVHLNLGKDTCYHYKHLAVQDLFVLLRPSGQVQQPILLEAIQSLKIVAVARREKKELEAVEDGVIKKRKQLKKPVMDIYREFADEIENDSANFDIQCLTQQMRRECVYESDNYGDDISKWGDTDKRKWDNCTSLFLRTESLIRSKYFKKVFGFEEEEPGEKDLTVQLKKFLTTDDQTLLRINFEHVGYDFQAREILGNALGRLFLDMAREGTFRNDKPLTVFIDEAHQFLNKNVKDEYFENVELEAFSSIAKECRKHGLFLCISTQMPRDIPHGTLSQMGTFIVHRLINPRDKEAVENACSSANRNTLDFLPVLGEGEAILTGVDFPMPIILKIDMPTYEPESKTPRLKIYGGE